MPVIENKGSYILLTAVESYSLQAYKVALNDARTACKAAGIYRALADIRNINANIPALDKFELGLEIAKVLGNRIKLAIVAPVFVIDGLGENTAVNRGARVLVTDSMEKALAWLESD